MGSNSSLRNAKCLFCLLFLCLPSGLFAQRTLPYTINGRVAQPDDQPAGRAVVKLTGETGFSQQVSADDTGRYELREVPVGRYFLTAVNPSAPNQYADRVEVDLNHADSHWVTINIFLRIRAASSDEGRTPGVVSLAEEIQAVPKPARKAFEQALKLRGKKRYDQSLMKFDHSIELFPSYFQALAERGHLFIAMGRLPEAMKDFEQALRLNPHYGPAWRGVGLCEFQQNKYAQAVQDLERASNAEPSNATDFYFMGIACVALDRREQAVAALNKALSLDPAGSVRAHVHLASILIKENRLPEAAKEIETYLDAVPNPFDADRLRALLIRLRAASKQ